MLLFEANQNGQGVKFFKLTLSRDLSGKTLFLGFFLDQSQGLDQNAR